MFNGSSTASATVNDYVVTLYKTKDVPSSASVLGSYSNTLTADNVVYIKGETSSDGLTSDILVLPVYIQIDEKKVDVDEKIYLQIYYTSSSGTVSIAHYNGTSPDDIKIKIPYSSGR